MGPATATVAIHDKGSPMGDETELYRRSLDLYERAMFGADETALDTADQVLDTAEADLALARGRLVHVRFLADRKEDPAELADFERAVELYHRLGAADREAEALFWVGCFHHVVRGDTAAAVPWFERSYRLAEEAGDALTRSYAARHLGYADQEAGRLEAAEERFTESLRLRREVGHRQAESAAMLVLAELVAERGRLDEALALAAEAGTVAAEAGAYRFERLAGQLPDELRRRYATEGGRDDG